MLVVAAGGGGRGVQREGGRDGERKRGMKHVLGSVQCYKYCLISFPQSSSICFNDGKNLVQGERQEQGQKTRLLPR